MRYLLLRSLAALACFGVFSLPQTSAAPKPDQPDDPNFSGSWALDLKASTSFEPLMKQIGASLLERKYAASVKLKATIHQTEHVLTIAARGPGFALDETLYLDGRTAPSKLDLLGATSLKTRTAWSKDPTSQLIEAHQDQNQTGKRGPTDHQKVPDRRRENLGGCLHPKAQRRTKPNLCPPNLA